MVYILVLISNIASVDANIYSFGPEFISKEYCEEFAKRIPKDRANYHLCLPIK